MTPRKTYSTKALEAAREALEELNVTQVSKATFRAETRRSIGEDFSEEVFNRAYAKARRWAINAYGSADMAQYHEEVGGNLTVYYQESIEKGGDTFNRQNDRNARGGAR